MHAAAQLGLAHAVALLGALCPALVTAPDAGGVTPLGLAAREGAAEAGVALLAAGADANDDDTVCSGASAYRAWPACHTTVYLTHRAPRFSLSRCTTLPPQTARRS
jgi:hypothetical protein